MPLTAAEKQRRYRQRRDADPDRRETYLQKEREAWKRRKTTGKVKPITALSERQQRKQRRYWRKAQRKHRAQKNAAEQSQETPRNTPEGQQATGSSRQKQQGRRKVNRDRSKCYRQLEKLQQALRQQTKLAERYKKRAQRASKKFSPNDDTPRSKTRKLLRNWKGPRSSEVRKTLVFHYAVVSDIAEKYRSSKGERAKRACGQLLTGRIVRKYKLQKLAQDAFGFSQKRWKDATSNDAGLDVNIRRKRKANAAAEDLKALVKAFYNRDDVSRMTTGKKDTKTKYKKKMQKRLLSDTMINIHRKFLSENPRRNISYALFCRLRPYWVIHPTIEDRQTCQCKTHENLQFMANKLHQCKLLDSADIERLADSISCNADSKDCMYGECDECKQSTPKIPAHDEQQGTFYWQWVSKKVEREDKDGQKTSSQVTAKEEIQTTLGELVRKFRESLSKFRKHVFNIRHQYAKYRDIKKVLTDQDCIIHIDFAENYGCKYTSEIQAVHFGASHQQATLHTGVFYVGSAEDVSIQDTVSFCTISACRRHDPPAIWAYMDPVFQYIKEKYPSVHRLHFFSDGPTTQYRQKGNFYLFSVKPYELGFECASWNLWEASHGKGAPDGVGGAIKRTADKLVSLGKDIPDARSLFDAIVEAKSGIKLFYVEEDEVELVSREMPTDLPTVPGTMRIHQLLTQVKGEFHIRDISCACHFPQSIMCSCYGTKLVPYSQNYQNIEPEPQPADQAPPAQDPTAEINTLKPIEPGMEDADLIGKWVVVKYDDDGFPGIVLSVEEDNVEVHCMARAGINRFSPTTKPKDILWYPFDDIISLIPEPVKIGRHYVVYPLLWPKIQRLL